MYSVAHIAYLLVNSFIQLIIDFKQSIKIMNLYTSLPQVSTENLRPICEQNSLTTPSPIVTQLVFSYVQSLEGKVTFLMCEF